MRATRLPSPMWGRERCGTALHISHLHLRSRLNMCAVLLRARCPAFWLCRLELPCWFKLPPHLVVVAWNCLAGRQDDIGRPLRPSPERGMARAMMAVRQKKIVPCLLLWARGSPAFLSVRFPSGEGDGAPTRRIARITP